MDQASNLLDPYFAAPQGAGLAKHTQELSMYEMDGCDSTELTGSTPDSLWVLPQGRRIRNPILSMNESRLDTRWRSRHDTGWVV